MEATKPFTPSQNDLRAMIANAMAKCDADCEQAALKREARDNARMEQAWTAQARSIARAALSGSR